ncbi:MAG: aminoacyl-tRNA hydrolase [Candidatus Omnitrophica bacterium]|nr:aminoacyl-tRNA hydrolase [Candidatus Omnitrophota bacterium]
MKIIVGLGNPGLVYAGSRHNIGFMVVKSLARGLKVALKKDGSAPVLVGRTCFRQHDLILALPLTFMNLSGIAVKALLKKFKADAPDLLVVCDDLDLELGRIKLRPHGSSAGQRGIVSIIEQLGTQNFNRLRIGIGRPKRTTDAARYVLSGFLRKEKAAVEQAKEEAASCCLSWVEKGVTKTMSSFNAGPSVDRQGLCSCRDSKN